MGQIARKLVCRLALLIPFWVFRWLHRRQTEWRSYKGIVPHATT